MAETSLTSGHEPSINSRRNWRSVYIKCGADNVTVAGATRVSSDKQRANRTGGNLATRDRFYRYRLYFLFLFLLLSLSLPTPASSPRHFFFSNQRYLLFLRDDCAGIYREEVPVAARYRRAISARGEHTRERSDCVYRLQREQLNSHRGTLLRAP